MVHEESLAIMREQGDRKGIAYSLEELAADQRLRGIAAALASAGRGATSKP